MTDAYHVTSNLIDGHARYGVFRVIDASQPDHSGNRSSMPFMFDSKDDAQAVALWLNKEIPEAGRR